MEIKLPEISEAELAKIKKEKMNEILNDEEIKTLIEESKLSLKDVENGLYHFSQYLKQRKLCEECKGLSSCNKSGSHLILKIKIDENKNVKTILAKCDKQKELDKVLSKFVIKQFDDEILYNSLKSCLDYFAVERHQIIKRLLEFKTNPSSNSVYLFGPSGNGKSHILKVFSGFLAKQSATKSIAFIDCNDELSYMQKLYSTDESYFEYYFETFKDVQYLFLDDLGKEFKSKIILENILLPLIKYRNEKNLVTFISSNYGIIELSSVYGYGQDMKSLAYSLSNELKSKFDEYYLGGLKFSILK